MNLLYPRFSARLLPTMLGYASLAALIAGLYGILHDQVTYTISPEYFTKLKFSQFSYADFGFPPRVFVAEIGFLATWWVGFFGAWFLARIAVPALPPPVARRYVLLGILIVIGFAIVGFLAGYAVGGLADAQDRTSEWVKIADLLDIEDVPAFLRVAYIHWASYLSGLVGIIVALVVVWRARARRA